MVSIPCAQLVLLTCTIALMSCGSRTKTPEPGLQDDGLCASAAEYSQTLKYLRSSGSSSFQESFARRLAEQVAGNCTGAFTRFRSAYELLTKSGVAEEFSARLALDLSGMSKDAVSSFVESFKYLYLGEHLDLDFKSAVGLSRLIAIEAAQLNREAGRDFVAAVKDCQKNTSDGGLSLSRNECLELGLKLVQKGRYFKDGAYPAFIDILRRLSAEPETGLNLSQKLDVALRVISEGPLAPVNFWQAYEFARSQEGLDLNAKAALGHALKISSKSHRGDNPPLVMTK